MVKMQCREKFEKFFLSTNTHFVVVSYGSVWIVLDRYYLSKKLFRILSIYKKCCFSRDNHLLIYLLYIFTTPRETRIVFDTMKHRV